MSRRPNEKLHARIGELLRLPSKPTLDRMLAILRSEGFEVSRAGVHKIASSAAAKAPAKPARKARPSTPRAPSRAPAVDLERDDDEDVTTTLRRTLASLERAARAAEETGDVARLVAAQRAVTQAAGLLAKVTPPPAVDPADAPDMRALGEQAAARLTSILESLAAEARAVA